MNHVTKIKIEIIASGPEYQRAAALSAGTFAVHARSPGSVGVLVPDNEKPLPFLTLTSKELNFVVNEFPFKAKHKEKYTSQLKCQAFAWQINRLATNEVVIFADADTCCLKPIQLPRRIKRQILSGQIGMIPDIADRHFQDPSAPWYLTPAERSIYVNSGVIFASKQGHSFFERVRNLSEEPRFLRGPFNDQKVINFALGRHFPGLLLLLARRFNAIRSINETTIIAHFAGGAGFLPQQQRGRKHEQMCLKVLRASGQTIDSLAGRSSSAKGR